MRFGTTVIIVGDVNVLQFDKLQLLLFVGPKCMLVVLIIHSYFRYIFYNFMERTYGAARGPPYNLPGSRPTNLSGPAV